MLITCRDKIWKQGETNGLFALPISNHYCMCALSTKFKCNLFSYPDTVTSIIIKSIA